MDPLEHRLRKLARRLAAQQWVRYCVTGLLITVSAAFVWVILTRLFPVLGDPRPVAFGLIGLGAVASTVLAILRRPSLVDAALQADITLGLRERLTSSLQMAGQEGPMVEALHADARRKLDTLDFQGQFPLASNRAMRWVFAPLAAFALSYLFFPQLDLLKHEEKVAEAKAKEASVDVHVQRIEEALKPLEDESGEVASIFADVQGDLAKLAEDMKAGALTEKQTLAKLSNLTAALEKQREGLNMQNPRPQALVDPEKLGLAKDLAAAIQQGNMADAAKQAKRLAEQMKNGELTKEQQEQLSKNLSDLAKMLGGANSEMGEALSKAMAQAAEAMKNGDSEAMEAAMKALELSMEDLESILQQLEQMDGVMAEMKEWQNSLLGPSAYCRNCGTKLKECKNGGECTEHDGDHECAGVCGNCNGSGNGPGMGGPGRGQGNEVGELPDAMVGFQPSKPGGPLTKGRMLADVLQKAAPDDDAVPTTDYISGAFVQLQQNAEQALTQQEIPRGSKEFVRQYFGSIEPEDE